MYSLLKAMPSFGLAYKSWSSVSILIVLVLCSAEVGGQPLFENSVVSHDIDLIATDVPTVRSEVRFLKNDRREMPDKRREHLFDNNAHVFNLE